MLILKDTDRMRIVDHTFYRVLLISYTVHIKYIQCQMQIPYNLLALSTSAFNINPPFMGVRLNVRRNPWVLKAFLPAAVEPNGLKNWPFYRLLSAVSTCTKEHQCHTIIGLILEHWALLRSSSRLAVTTTQTFLHKYVLYIQTRVTLFAGAITSHTGKQSLRALKTTFLSNMEQGIDVLAPLRFCWRIFQDVYSPGN